MKANSDLIDLFGTSQPTLWWDFETRSHCDLKKHGPYRYATDPTTEVLCAAWGVGEGAIQIWLPGEPFPPAARLALLSGAFLAAHNAAFDRLIWQYVAENDHGFPPLEIDQTYCTAAQARARGYPGKLEHLGRALGLPADKRKQRRGTALIRKMSIPPFEYSAELMAEMGAYCIQDTETMRECARRTPPLSKIELDRYWLSERINDRGLRVDVPLAEAAAAYAVLESQEINQKITRLTNGAVSTGRQFKRLQRWLEPRLSPEAWKLTQTYKTDRQTKETTCKTSLGKTVRFNLLALLEEHPDACLDRAALDVIELLDEAGRTSVSKYQAMVDRADTEDQRVRGAYVFAGAGQTGRWSSTAIQMHNLSRDVAKDPEEMRSLILAGKELPGGVLDDLASMLRPSILGSFFCGDWSAIEARVMPWLSIAGSGGGHQKYCNQQAQERLNRMAAGEDLYVAAAESFGGTRQEGKTAELACLAEGTRVLTERGEVPIERVGLSDRVWDGEAFVPHDGLVYQGYREVITYAGLTATPDHEVFTAAGKMYFGDASSSETHITKSGAGGRPVRAGRNYLTRAAICLPKMAGSLCACALRRLWPGKLGLLRQPDHGEEQGVRAVFATPNNTALAKPTVHRRQIALRKPERSGVEELRGAGSGVSVPVCDCCRAVDDGKPRGAPRAGVGSDRQQWPLRAWKSALGYPQPKRPEQTHGEAPGGLGLLARAMAIFKMDNRRETAGGGDAGGCARASVECRGREEEELARNKTKAPVYDLLNCGPRHRFTANGLLVSNCGYQGSVGAFQAMARQFNLSIPDEKAQRIVNSWRESNPWAVNFWKQLDEAAKSAMRHPGLRFPAGRVEYERVGDVLRCYLPSGRFLSYPDVQWARDRWDRPCITFLKGSWTAKADGAEWPRCDLYGGQMCENAVQAVAADVLGDAMAWIDARCPGLIVGHTHDEILCENARGYQHEIIREEMRRSPVWAPGLPLAAEFWSGRRYRK